MTTVASRDLRNRTSDVLRQVAGGTPVTITVNCRPVADLTAHRSSRRTSLSRSEFLELVLRRQADARLRVSRSARPRRAEDERERLVDRCHRCGHDLPVVTQDADFGAIEDLGGPKVVRV